MSSDAKVWKDKEGWHGISDWHDKELISHDYALTDILTEIEDKAGQQLDWDIFEFSNGVALRGYRARPSDCECHNTIPSPENDFTSKSYSLWVSMKVQCYLNPNKIIAIVTPRGRYELKYIPDENKK